MIPKPGEIIREAIIVLAGAALAAFVIGQLPGVKSWMARQWAGAGQPPTP